MDMSSVIQALSAIGATCAIVGWSVAAKATVGAQTQRIRVSNRRHHRP
ncbi:hypothetical protein [Oceaniglobus indicus]|nr:hypothetical protein [Oceaniglobus indicus]